MAQGRCAGCGQVGPVSKIEKHVVGCPASATLFQADPDRLLTPAAEFLRWQREDCSPEAKAQRKETRLHTEFTRQDVRRAQQESRWATPADLLAD